MALNGIRMRLRSLLVRSRVESELDEEVRFHLEQQTQLYVRHGMSHDAARRRALIDFGGIDNTKEAYRDGSGTRDWVDRTSMPTQCLGSGSRACWCSASR